jgi:response regulator RpfG family c-di-GMP phosphodiesterase
VTSSASVSLDISVISYQFDDSTNRRQCRRGTKRKKTTKKKKTTKRKKTMMTMTTMTRTTMTTMTMGGGGHVEDPRRRRPHACGRYHNLNRLLALALPLDMPTPGPP